ncbi:hypothetical protein K461DRAFT_269902 [Myriangium duriaei CBS 260.36]|uniref:Uncharacterized protein n=1 Tax=Myriangium duriaei CBS 260.36 TaxID=1168546 RepID=A0A9P4MDW4_9PEZI|nr:hypothetical protein K461DRAFT_269902 [Myriangium duriaei CBS 260.36]
MPGGMSVLPFTTSNDGVEPSSIMQSTVANAPSSPTSKCHLMTVPREVRDLIFESCRQLRQEEIALKHLEHTIDDGCRKPFWQTHAEGVRVKNKAPDVSLLMLRLCNKQLSEEIEAKRIYNGVPFHIELGTFFYMRDNVKFDKSKLEIFLQTYSVDLITDLSISVFIYGDNFEILEKLLDAVNWCRQLKSLCFAVSDTIYPDSGKIIDTLTNHIWPRIALKARIKIKFATRFTTWRARVARQLDRAENRRLIFMGLDAPLTEEESEAELAAEMNDALEEEAARFQAPGRTRHLETSPWDIKRRQRQLGILSAAKIRERNRALQRAVTGRIWGQRQASLQMQAWTQGQAWITGLAIQAQGGGQEDPQIEEQAVDGASAQMQEDPLSLSRPAAPRGMASMPRVDMADFMAE